MHEITCIILSKPSIEMKPLRKLVRSSSVHSDGSDGLHNNAYLHKGNKVTHFHFFRPRHVKLICFYSMSQLPVKILREWALSPPLPPPPQFFLSFSPNHYVRKGMYLKLTLDEHKNVNPCTVLVTTRQEHIWHNNKLELKPYLLNDNSIHIKHKMIRVARKTTNQKHTHQGISHNTTTSQS